MAFYIVQHGSHAHDALYVSCVKMGRQLYMTSRAFPLTPSLLCFESYGNLTEIIQLNKKVG
jgi:hypothetical protein